MKFSIIGTGNMAWFLATRLTDAGHDCAGIYGRDKNNSTTLATAANSIAYNAIEDIGDQNDLCLLAVSDNAVAMLASQLHFKNTVVLHTAGSIPLNVLDTACTDNGVIWPVYSIIKDELPTHRDIPCTWETSTRKAEEILFHVADAITDMLFYTDSEQRKWLHMAAVIGNNFTNHLMAVCEQICTQQHLPFSILQPILHQTFERTTHASPFEKQTGPAKRNDKLTLKTHQAMLASNPHWQQLYASVSSSIENMYRNIHEETGPKD